MTSMPASRRARAMILAPRSCPSRPGLATTTRILRWVGVAGMFGSFRDGSPGPEAAGSYRSAGEVRILAPGLVDGRAGYAGSRIGGAARLPCSMAEIEVGDVVLARGTTGRFHAVVSGV